MRAAVIDAKIYGHAVVPTIASRHPDHAVLAVDLLHSVYRAVMI